MAWWTIHALWIVGLAIVLAAFSYHDWLRRERGILLRVQLQESGFRRALAIGLLLVAVGLILLRESLWQRSIWAAAALSLAWEAFRSARRRPSD